MHFHTLMFSLSFSMCVFPLKKAFPQDYATYSIYIYMYTYLCKNVDLLSTLSNKYSPYKLQ